MELVLLICGLDRFAARSVIDDIQLHIKWLNHVDLEIIAERGGVLTSLLRYLAISDDQVDNMSQRVLI